TDFLKKDQLQSFFNASIKFPLFADLFAYFNGPWGKRCRNREFSLI
uniref:Uncharacterized protein n=1 Tax=Anopheles minimus TaxID=112268 RepID=A0A182WNM1_9DIPT